MRSIIRRDPFREILSLRNAMDQLFDSAFVGAPWDWQGLTTELPLDVAENPDEYLVKASASGPRRRSTSVEATAAERIPLPNAQHKADAQRKAAEQRPGNMLRQDDSKPQFIAPDPMLQLTILRELSGMMDGQHRYQSAA